MKKFIAIFLMILLLVSVTGCNSNNISKVNSTGETILKVGAIFDFKSSREGLTLISDSLVGMDEKYNATPSLVNKWDVNEDATEYVLHLKENIKFHDGSLFDAKTCKYSIETLGKQFMCTYINTLETTEIIDEYILKIKFKSSNLGFPKELMKIVALPVGSVDEDGNITNFNGTGPYKLNEYKKDVEATLVKNEDYWDKDRSSSLQKIKWIVIPDPDARVMALESNQVDLIGYTEHHSSIPYSNIVSLINNDKYQSVIEDKDNYTSVKAIGMNWKSGPLTDSNLRRALEHVIDRNKLVETVFFSIPNPCGHIMNPKFDDGSKKEEEFKYDIELAKKILEESGYKYEKEILKKDGIAIKLDYICNSLPEDKDIAVFIQSELKKIGITVNIVALETEQTYQHIQNGEYDLTIATPWFEPTVNTISLYGLEDNYSMFGLGLGINEKVKTYGQEVISAMNESEFKVAIDGLWKASYEACTSIPLFTGYRYAIHNGKFTGFQFDNNYFKIDFSEVREK
ncbi:ABC transporter substrate-binding protein [Vallitalea sp.]|jgi:peptide/nickel transport system substrate-binding protein/nickel transport system substrate-binding protein|uniref:ABC transporter substrate-binding protein n=1 Tax=Vallitalea sp. TaxID=1882829 RepID=UPI0025DAE1D6|nr:ABC transporter substrate-binding protein [Vallitalea sp.]MCT4688432.1 ABC transporter substrate-binding protein [Vallitalea sp.]